MSEVEKPVSDNVFDSASQIYPKIVQETEVNDLINKSKNTDRLKHMLREQTLLEEKLIKYNKIKDRWNKADVTIKITGTILIFISTSLAIISGVIGSLGVLTPVVSGVLAAIFSGLSLFKASMIEILSIGLTSKRKRFYQQRIELVKEYINKFFYYFEKCKEDGIITIEELQNFDKLLEEYNNKILELKLKQNKKSRDQVANPGIDGNFKMLKEKDKKKIDKKVVNDFKVEQLKNYYEEQVKKIKNESVINVS